MPVELTEVEVEEKKHCCQVDPPWLMECSTPHGGTIP